jgi:nucleotide-binding universal stress UspA family protein
MRVLVATDGSEYSLSTADYVTRLAAVLPLDLDLAFVVRRHEPVHRGSANVTTEALLDRVAEFLRSRGVAVNPRVLYGNPAAALCRTATQEDISLLVLGRRGHGELQDILFGSVSNKVVNQCAKPTLVVKKGVPVPNAAPGTHPVRVLVAVDGSRGANECLKLLAAFGAPKAFDVTLLSVVNPEPTDVDRLSGDLRYKALQDLHRGAETILKQAAARLSSFAVHRRVDEGKPGPTICRVAQEEGHEIVLVGRRGLGEIADILFGSVSHYVLHHSPSHVLLVP